MRRFSTGFQRALVVGLVVCGPLAALPWAEALAEARQLRGVGTNPAQWRRALGLLEAALAGDVPEARRAELEFLRGCAAFDLGDAARAVQALQFACQREPRQPLYRLWLGYAYDLDGRSTLAVRSFRAVHADPRADAASRRSAAEWLEQLHEPVTLAALEPAGRTVIPGAVIFHHRGEPFAGWVRAALETARERLARVVGVTVDEPVEVVLFFDAEEYRQYHEQRDLPRPEWSTACSAHGRIYSYPAAGAEDQLQATLIHEYCHVALRAAAGDRTLPVWLDEGLAVLLSGQFAGHREDLRAAPRLLGPRTMNLPSFSLLERDDAYLAYAQAKGLAEELLRSFGAARVRAYLAALAETNDPDRAFETTFGGTFEAFLDGFAADVAGG